MKKTSLAKEKFNSLLLSATLTMIVTYALAELVQQTFQLSGSLWRHG